MADDRVKRLRDLVGQHIGDADIDDELSDAADHIEKLEAALREIAYTEPEDKYWPGRIARKALEGKDD